MSKSLTNLALYSEEAITNELPDVALEVASKGWEAGNPTIAFCTGLDTCPSHPPTAAGQS
jgi:hypothetical protein